MRYLIIFCGVYPKKSGVFPKKNGVYPNKMWGLP